MTPDEEKELLLACKTDPEAFSLLYGIITTESLITPCAEPAMWKSPEI
jgi:hypothetical protein